MYKLFVMPSGNHEGLVQLQNTTAKDISNPLSSKLQFIKNKSLNIV
ncbi:mCG146882 [Mus musculus]|jgi:hypothetical protein|nr:mCG146882 [Mus musculus]